MKRWMTFVMGVAMAAVCLGSSIAIAGESGGFIDEDGDGIHDRAAFRHRRGGSALLSLISAQLTDVQRAALQEKISALISNGATHLEIQEAVFAELEGFGIDVIAAYLERFSPALTEEQLAGLKGKLDALKANGATQAEIRAALHQEITALGVFNGDRGLDRLGRILTEEQMADLQVKIDALVAQGAARSDIHAAIQAELMALGIELPQRGGPMEGMRGGPRGARGRGPAAAPPARRGGGGGGSKE